MKRYKHTQKITLLESTKVRVKITAPERKIYKDALRYALNSIRRELDKLAREERNGQSK